MTDQMDLTCRLLAACACTYAIETPGRVKTCPQFPFVGFKDDPATFQAGSDDINACLVGDMGDGVVLAFRGTIPFDHRPGDEPDEDRGEEIGEGDESKPRRRFGELPGQPPDGNPLDPVAEARAI